MYCSDALQKAVTALYANVLVILGFALPLAEVISARITQGEVWIFRCVKSPICSLLRAYEAGV